MTIAAELLALRNKDGMIEAPKVVQWARRHTKSRLYHVLEWDNEVAGEKHRIWQVRQLIAVHVVDAEGSRQAVSLSIDRRVGGYRHLDDIMPRQNLREVMLQDALDELERVEAKYKRLQELEQVWIATHEVRETRGRRKAA